MNTATLRCFFSAVSLAVLMSGPSQGSVILGTSQGYAVRTNLTVQLLNSQVQANVGPIALAEGTAPPAYSESTTVLAGAADVSVGNLGLGTSLLALTTGELVSTATSDVDSGLGPRTTTATSVISDLDLDVVSSFLADLLSVEANTISTGAIVSGDFETLGATGGTTVEDLTISLLGTDLAFDGSIAANTTLDLDAILAGVTIVLNEQILTGDGITTRGIVTNAIHITFDGAIVAGIGSLSGEVVIGHAEALMQAVPEPSSLALAGLGLAFGVAGMARRRCTRRVP